MISRRGFIKLASAATAIAAFIPSSLAFAKKVALKLAKVPKLSKIGGWTILKVKKKDIMFIRDGEDSVKAFNPECTHQACTVGYNHESGYIECPCHNSLFDLEGKVIKGPATEPLERYTASLKDERIIVSIDD